MDARILVVEDDRLLAKVLSDNLLLEGFEVARAADANSAVNVAREFMPDLIILDVMLPDRSGFDVFSTLHQEGRTPIMFLTARGQKADKVRGLNLGGDDYITKPFDLEELLARVHAVLRRARANVEQLKLGDVIIDLAKQSATRGDEVLHLTSQEFRVLNTSACALAALFIATNYYARSGGIQMIRRIRGRSITRFHAYGRRSNQILTSPASSGPYTETGIS